MTHTIEEAKQLSATVKETKRVLQVGSQTTSADQWWKAKKAIADGMIGRCSRARVPTTATRWKANELADRRRREPGRQGENYIDWKTWLGPRPSAPSMPTATSASVNIGTTPAASRRICSSTWSRR